MEIRFLKYIVLILFFGNVFSKDIYFNKPEYCSANLPKPSENTDGMTLKMVQVLTRHGDRSPIYSTVNTKMNQWNCNLGIFQSPSIDKDSVQDVNYLFRKVYMPDNEFKSDCVQGQLTTLGYQQHLELGSVLRDLYVNKYNLLSQEFNESEIYIRSTDYTRTHQSAQGHINGLYPSSKSNSKTKILNIHSKDLAFEDMYPNPNVCPILTKYYNDLLPIYVNVTSQYQQLRDQLLQLFEISSFPGWCNMMDLMYASICHGIPLPEGVSQEMVDKTYEASFYEATYQIQNPYILRLSMSSFLEHVMDNINNVISGKDNKKYIILSGHDISVQAFHSLFKMIDRWAPYRSHMELELWQDSNSNNFIQLKYNGESIKIDGCSEVMCKFDQFMSFIDKILIKNYKEVCNDNNSI